MSSAIYVLGFVAKGTLPENLKIGGLETGHCVVQREFTGITAVVSQVPLSYFVGEEAETRLNDIEWVAPRALNHQRYRKNYFIEPNPSCTIWCSFFQF